MKDDISGNGVVCVLWEHGAHRITRDPNNSIHLEQFVLRRNNEFSWADDVLSPRVIASLLETLIAQGRLRL
jgi:hypothetical protein